MSAGPHLGDATVVIVGVGLMGGSLGLALDGHVARRIGVVADDADAAAVIAAGAVDEVTDLAAAAAVADLVVIATPVGQIGDVVRAAALHLREGAVVTDLGSVKRPVVEAFDTLPDHVHAIAGHPMCGSEVSGVAGARAGLFQGARWVLCPGSRTTAEARALVSSLIAAVGAEPVELAAGDHDRAVAYVSHLPYVLGQLLAHAAAGVVVDDELHATTLAAGGFRDATRLTGGDVSMWRDILLANRDEISAALSELEAGAAQLRERMDEPALEAWLAAGRLVRQGLGSSRR